MNRPACIRIPDQSCLSRRQKLMDMHATLASGCAFMLSHAGEQPDNGSALPVFARTRMVGNRLRELDRFLSNLIGASAAFLCECAPDDNVFARLRNTANKLRIIETNAGMYSMDAVRLRAIGRIIACLHHCAGKIYKPEIHKDVMLASGRSGALVAPRESFDQLKLDPQTIISISDFYSVLGDRLLAEALAQAPRT